VTLAEVLKSAGYTTGIFGKWHLGDEPDRWPSRRGFDEMFIHGAGGIGQSYPGSCGDAPGNTYFNPAILHNGTFVRTTGYCTDVFFTQALSWIDEVKGRQPFFCYIATNAPHAPLDVRPEDEARYTDKVRNRNVAKFFGMIANIDDNVGRLLAKLKERELESNTLVIFMNDNGGTVGIEVHNAGMRGSKNSPWLGGTRASSLWRWSGTLQPADCDRLAAHVDVFPTLAELAGAEISDRVKSQVEGRSLAPLLLNPNEHWQDRVLVTHIGRWPKGDNIDDYKYANCSVRTTRWHMVSASNGRKQWQLFDIQNDRGESTDVAVLRPEVIKELDAKYDEWWRSLPPHLVNENAVGPETNPFAQLYWKQFGGAPSEVR
jgi:arylsulfatase